MFSNKHNIKAIITDLDGTLFGLGHKVSPRTLEVLARIQKESHHEIPFIVATGRPHGDVFGSLMECGLEPDYIITSNGARVHDREHRVVCAHNIDPVAAHRILQTALAVAEATTDAQWENSPDGAAPRMDESNSFSLEPLHGRPYWISVYRESEWLMDQPCPEAIEESHPTCVCQSIGIGEMAALTPETLSNVHGMYFQGSQSKLLPLSEKFSSPSENGRTADDRKWGVHFTFSAPFVLSCVPPGIGKGKALEEVAALLGISPSEVAAFGDGMNDEAMLRTAGFPFVMQNANPALKAALPHAPVIGSNLEDGVARELEALFFPPSFKI